MTKRCSKCYGSIDGSYTKCPYCGSIFHGECLIFRSDLSKNSKGDSIKTTECNCPDCGKTFITDEINLSKKKREERQMPLCCGSVCVILILAYVIFYVIPNADRFGF